MNTTPSELAGILNRVTIFSGLTPEHLDTIIAECKVITCPQGQVIIKEGSTASEIYIILSGRVKIVLGLDGPSPVEIGEFGEGNCIGEAAVIGVLVHSASVVIMQEARLLVLSRQFLTDTFKQDTQLFSMLILNLARELARRLHGSDKIIYDLSRGQ